MKLPIEIVELIISNLQLDKKYILSNLFNINWIKNKCLIEYNKKFDKTMLVIKDLDILNMWLIIENDKIKERYSYNALIYWSLNGNLNMLNWWKNSGIVMDYPYVYKCCMCDLIICENYQLEKHISNWWEEV